MKDHGLPIRFLIRHSGRLLLYFILASAVISSLYEPDLKIVILKFIPVSILFVFVFFSNIMLLVFFEQQKRTPREKTGRKVFISGWIMTIFLITVFHFIVRYLQARGWYIAPPTERELEMTSGWRLFIYFPYVSLIMYTFVYLIQNFMLHQFEKNRIEMELLKLKSVNAETSNQLLQQQIQPHFLFNALNILKSLIRKYPQTAEAYLIRLSDFLRASISRNPSGLATLKEELKLCADYMEMQKIRFGEALKYEINLSPDDPAMLDNLPFFSLQPLLENAIKHNELTEEKPLIISIDKDGDHISVKNNLQYKKAIETSNGYGLSNLKERYQMLSGDDIIILEKDNFFIVRIKLLANEHRHYRG